VGKSDALKYFSFSHLEVEKSHEVFEKGMAGKIDAIYFAPELREEAEAMVDRCYAAFDSMFQALSEPQYVAPAAMNRERGHRARAATRWHRPP
jgi:hypothetical protein